MEDILVDREKRIVVEPGTTSTHTSKEDWEKLDRKSQNVIRIYLEDSVLLNVLE